MKERILISGLLLLLTFSGLAQSDSAQQDSTIYTAVDSIPIPPGGYLEFRKWLAAKVVGSIQRCDLGADGKVHVQFIVEKDGSLSEVSMVPGTESGGTQSPVVQERILRAMRDSGLWTPAQLAGKPVRMRFVLPVQVCVK